MSQLVHRAGPVRLALLAGIVLAAFALVWIGRASAGEGAPAATSGLGRSVSNIPTPRADAATHDFTSLCTCSPDYNDMPDMTKTFKLGGRIPNPVVVTFQGEFFDTGDQDSVAFMRLVIDGRVQTPSGVVIASYKPGAEETAGFTWVSEPLEPGTHTATIQWRDSGAAPMHAGATSMIILHK